MNFWLLLFLGLITYLILQRSVPRITNTPIWVLWMVMMTPASILSLWALIYGEDKPLPTIVAIGPFAICFILYWWLLQRGRRPPSPSPNKEKAQLPSSVSEGPKAADTKPGEPLLRPIDRDEEKQLRDCFPWSVYYLRNVEYRPQAVICRGQLRTNADEAYQTIQKNVESRFGDRFLLIFQESLSLSTKQPFFVLVPNPNARSQSRPKAEPVTRPALALGLLLITLFTTTVVGAQLAGIDDTELRANPGYLWSGLPYSLSLLAILGIHELGHYIAAQFHHLRTTLPYFIPFPIFLGTFGAFTQMRSPIPNRKVLFDVSLAGPIAGLAVTIPLLIWGLAHSKVVPLSNESGLLNFDELMPTFSLLLSVLGKLTLGDQLTAQMAIDLHPVAISGYLGLIFTAFNLMPVGSLDGGHMVHAMFGQRGALGIAQVARLLMLILSLIHPQLFLLAILLFLMPIRDEPALNDVGELDNRRDFCGLLAIALLVIILLPAPQMLTQALNF